MLRQVAAAAKGLRRGGLIQARPFIPRNAKVFFSGRADYPCASRWPPPNASISETRRSLSSESFLLKGTVKSLNSFREDWCVAMVQDEESNSAVKVVGIMPGLACGATVEFHGKWFEHADYGKQFRAEAFIQQIPRDHDGVAVYLEATMQNIGKVIAERIVEKFGEDTVDVLSGNDTSRSLCEVEGIGKKRALSIQEDWQKQTSTVLRDVITLLGPFRVSAAKCKLIADKYGANSISVIESNPYRIYREVAGFSFENADNIAVKMSIEPDNPLRVRAILQYELVKEQKNGHTALPVPYLIEKTSERLKLVKKDTIWDALDRLSDTGEVNLTIVDDLSYAQLAVLTDAEKCIADFLKQANLRTPMLLDKAIKDAEKKLDLIFSHSQISAIDSALTNQVNVITGGPGTGKTAILAALVTILKETESDRRVLLVAPTGRAAKRLSDATKGDAKTIHRLLGYNFQKRKFKYDEDNQLPADFVIIDEASMLDVPLASSLMRAIPDNCYLILVGDVDQLPSVGPGDVLHDIIKSKRVQTTRLSTIFRQSAESSIVAHAHAVNRGQFYIDEKEVCSNVSDLSDSKQFQFVDLQGRECSRVVAEVHAFVRNRLGRDPITDAQILAPMYNGPSGINILNNMFQQEQSTASTSVQLSDIRYFKEGDKVMQKSNDYTKDVFNGTVGVISNIDNDVVRIDFDGSLIEYSKSELDGISLAYAISIHKSQGSEYPIAIVVLTNSHRFMLQRKLLYTALTRGKEKVIVIGDRDSYELAVQNDHIDKRWTLLCQKLSE